MATYVRQYQFSFAHSIIHFLNRFGATIEHNHEPAILVESSSISVKEAKEALLQDISTSSMAATAYMRFY